MIRGIAASASQALARDSALGALQAGGTAVDAVLAGFFAAAGADPSVLLGPVHALVLGLGQGTRAYDARCVQPGEGNARPRGFLQDDRIPEPARAAAPRSLALLALLHALHGRRRFADLARAGILSAEAAGARARAALLKKVGAAGPLAFRSGEPLAALLEAAGPVAGGIFSALDLERAPDHGEASLLELSQVQAVLSPWATPTDRQTNAEVILAGDARGGLAVLSYRSSADVLLLPSLEVGLSLEGHPVMRGVTRVAPGTPVGGATPIAAYQREGGRAAVLGVPGRARLEPEEVGAWSEAEFTLGQDRSSLSDGGGASSGSSGEGAMSAERLHLLVWDGRQARVARGSAS